MARAIERIERDIAALKEAIGAIALQLQTAYASYLASLGVTLQKQLILATYHLCTQGYPENFLNLSLNQRQQLQQGIRKLSQVAAEQLVAYINSEEVGEDEQDEEVGEDEQDEEVGGDEEENTSLSLSFPDTSNPIELAKWQQNTEDITQEILKKVSHEANVLLQKAGILPKKLPEPILAAAAAAASEASAEVMPGPPNLLNLIIEIDNEQQSEDSGLTQIMAINLRLGEIEFADPTLSSERRQIRGILVQLNKLEREYQKKLREKTVAEAEAAWRASWFEN
ncbi:hypothetical protein VF14_23805 [Nostoc linckia z18]|uniref:Primosomal protein n=2 Tax=Nostoc linckia TaxID=92942 RepID=A0A9Q5Z8Y1_NOSLI|nr:hypothetical protein [Nostoc linckia]PHK32178.1 hypothetical protein VF12_27015 [Nostoc linckia z15]PHK42704.1 hypothetical protein VF13_29225 [Nostoc linckia z16]PHJ61061.1 hypothetical protein VF02_20865 [Nostoc linckia z1]PHJ64839.1 hypothetical protein VF05_22070 [Nostoc linckia z3]PHJ76334.1 hypothetical protein VF03_07555 [Nostoc linckia z2]